MSSDQTPKTIVIPDSAALPAEPIQSFRTITDPFSVITPIEGGKTFPECVPDRLVKYREAVELFSRMVEQATSSAELLGNIRSPKIPGETRMSLLKIFRRCVSLACDTEATKKINKTPTASLVRNLGHTFKPISILKKDFGTLTEIGVVALCVVLGENDERGRSGYALTGIFFNWFTATFPDMSIGGPKGAGRDVELSTVFARFEGDYPCDFVIRLKEPPEVLAVGFARYDGSRGGSQSDDRPGGNENKVEKAIGFYQKTGIEFRILFLADGPGLTHSDTWREAQKLDGLWDGRVRVTTLKAAPQLVTREWLLGAK
jgi:hypothetical protein